MLYVLMKVYTYVCMRVLYMYVYWNQMLFHHKKVILHVCVYICVYRCVCGSECQFIHCGGGRCGGYGCPDIIRTVRCSPHCPATHNQRDCNWYVPGYIRIIMMSFPTTEHMSGELRTIFLHISCSWGRLHDHRGVCRVLSFSC